MTNDFPRGVSRDFRVKMPVGVKFDTEHFLHELIIENEIIGLGDGFYMIIDGCHAVGGGDLNHGGDALFVGIAHQLSGSFATVEWVVFVQFPKGPERAKEKDLRVDCAEFDVVARKGVANATVVEAGVASRGRYGEDVGVAGVAAIHGEELGGVDVVILAGFEDQFPIEVFAHFACGMQGEIDFEPREVDQCVEWRAAVADLLVPDACALALARVVIDHLVVIDDERANGEEAGF